MYLKASQLQPFQNGRHTDAAESPPGGSQVGASSSQAPNKWPREVSPQGTWAQCRRPCGNHKGPVRSCEGPQEALLAALYLHALNHAYWMATQHPGPCPKGVELPGPSVPRVPAGHPGLRNITGWRCKVSLAHLAMLQLAQSRKQLSRSSYLMLWPRTA